MSQDNQVKGVYSAYPDSGFNEFTAPDITAWKLARSAIEHENNLVNHRMTWFFSSQAFLLTAFFVVASYSDKPVIKDLDRLSMLPVLFLTIGFLAIYVCLVTQNGLERAYIALDDITAHYDQLKQQHGFARVPPLHHWRKPALLNTRYVPVVTIVTWIILGSVFALARVPSIVAFTSGVTLEQAMLTASALLVIGGAISVGYILGKARKRTSRHWSRQPEPVGTLAKNP